MGIFDFVEDVIDTIADHVHEKIEENRTRRNKRMVAEASVASAVQAGRSPYEEEFRKASLQKVLAMSVDGVYYRDHSGMHLNTIVKPFVEGEYKVDEKMMHFTSNLYWKRFESIDEEEEKDARIKHYVRRPGNPCPSAPKLIIAIRGTKPSSVHDLVDDMRIAKSTIGFSSGLKQAEVLVRKIIKEYKKRQQEDDADHFSQSDDSETEIDMRLVPSRPVPNRVKHFEVGCDVCKSYPIVGIRYTSIRKQNYDLCQQCFRKQGALEDYTKLEGSDIYITGHSLGAALALQIGKKLAAEDSKQRYNVHCFNPPFVTLVQLIQDTVFISKAKSMLRKSHLEPLINVASHVKNLTKLTLAMVLENTEQVKTEVKHFMVLTNWMPVLYINAHDPICNRFMKHYKVKQKASTGFEVCTQALVSRVLGRRAVFSSLVPSVDMRISKLSKEPHAVKNWYLSPEIDEFHQFRLLPGFARHLIHFDEITESILFHPESGQEDGFYPEDASSDDEDSLVPYY